MKENMMSLTYALITPARNEEQFIEDTILSMVKQTRKPLVWIIVSDGSTDKTDEIVKSYCAQYSWIKLHRMPEHRDRHFGAKATCFNAGFVQIKELSFDIVGNLDADLTFEEDYFEYLLEQFENDKTLGVAGTPFVQGSFNSFRNSHMSMNHVSGACQLFRKKCFQDVGGYIPNERGGIDWIAVTTARMKGWKTQTFSDKVLHHHRIMGTGNSNFLIARFKHGQKDYYLGNHPLWESFRVIHQMKNKPYFISGLFLCFGYISALIQRLPRPVSKELIKFHQREQMTRLAKHLKFF